MLPSAWRMKVTFSCGTSFSRAQRTHCMREATSKLSWSSLTTIQTTLQQWLLKPKCGIQIFTPTEKCAFRSFTLQAWMKWMPKKLQRKDGDQFLELRQFWSASFQWWTIQISSLPQILTLPSNSEMISRGTRNKLGSLLPDHSKIYEYTSSEKPKS